VKLIAALFTAMLIATVAAGCSDSGGSASGSTAAAPGSASSPSAQSGGSNTESSATPTTLATTPVTPPPPPLPPDQLALAVKTAPFAQPTINDHLHVDDVGPAAYADGEPDGAIDSAEVSIRSDVEGQQVFAVYDVFADEQSAMAVYNEADANFRTFQDSSEPTYRTMTLSPEVPAFCALQNDGSTQCWLVHGVTTASLNVTDPGGGIGTDDQAILQALLDHLISVGG
jgi:hypothetical protein